MGTLLGIRADSWFDGFLGAILAGLIAVLVAYLTARGQTKVLRYQIQRDRYDRAFAELLVQLPALADRALTYASGSRRTEAVTERKDRILTRDANRVVVGQLHLLSDHPSRWTISQIPSVFAQYSTRFGEALALNTIDAEAATTARSMAVIAYVDDVVALIQEDYVGGATTRTVLPPTL